jgi:hypothetical protein
MKNYGLYDSIYGDCIETFSTLNEAVSYVQQHNYTNVKIGKYLNDFDDSYEVIMDL